MVVAVVNQKSLVPDLPREDKIAKSQGELDEHWFLFFDQLILALQTILSPEGIAVPQQAVSNITSITGTNAQASILYDSTNNAFNANIINNIVSTIQNWSVLPTLLTNAGNPNGVVAGNQYSQFCYDTTNKILYICTASGNPGTWTAV